MSKAYNRSNSSAAAVAQPSAGIFFPSSRQRSVVRQCHTYKSSIYARHRVMSGFEVAGIVLGSLPLIIAALEHYAEGVATAKRFWKYKSELRSLVLQINTERGIYINTLEQLLTGIVRVEHMADFLSNTGTWRDSDVEPKLKDRLRGAYAIYMDNVKGMEVVLETMMEKLALGADGKVRASAAGDFPTWEQRLTTAL